MVWMVVTAALAADAVDWAETPAAGQTWYAAGSGVNLRDAPSADGAVVGQLGLGQPVEVSGGPGAALTLGERTAPWVPVRRGQAEAWVWSGALTPWASTTDLDGDGRTERVVVAWRSDRHLVVRATPSDADAAVAAEEVDLGSFGDIDGALDRAEVRVTPASETGVPLVRVYVPGREMCGSGTWARYVAWTGRTVSLALSVDTWADAPVYSVDEATFAPAAREVTVVSRSSGDGEHESVKTTRRRWDGKTFAAVGGS